MFTHETSELSDPDLSPPNRATFQTSAVNELLLFYLLP